MRKRHYYLRIWIESLEAYKLSLLDSALLMLIISFSKKHGFCYASKKKLGEILRVSTVTIHARINKLKAKGLLEVVSDPSMNMATSCLRASPSFKQYVDGLVEWA